MHSVQPTKDVGHVLGVLRGPNQPRGHMQEWLTVGSERGASLREAR
jgi:hypothetical protein